MTDDMNMMEAALNEEALDEVNGGANTIDIDGIKVLCKRVRVQKGDTLLKYCGKYNTNIKAIMKVNPIIKNPNQIFLGHPEERIEPEDRAENRKRYAFERVSVTYMAGFMCQNLKAFPRFVVEANEYGHHKKHRA